MIKGVQLKGVIMAIGGFAITDYNTCKRFTESKKTTWECQ